MDEPNSMIDTEIQRELAAALRVEPAGDFRARVRTRIAGEVMMTRWHAAVLRCAGVAAIAACSIVAFIVVGSHQPPVEHSVATVVAETGQHQAGILGTPIQSSGPATRTARTTARHTPSRKAVSPPQPEPAPATDDPEVLLSASEQEGVRLLFESSSSGRLKLPEDMLRDLSLPIVEARTGRGEFDSPYSSDNKGDMQ